MKCGLKKLSVADARMEKGVQVCIKFGKILKRKRHKPEMTIRKDSWFEKSNLSLEEVFKLTYWWCFKVF